MPFDSSRTLLRALDGGPREKALRLRPIEARMHSRDVVERLGNPHPAGQHGDVGDEGDVAHELVAIGPGLPSEHLQVSLIGGEAEDRVERGGLAGAVGPDETEDAALLDAQIDPVQRNGGLVGLAEAACFYAGHGLNVPPAVRVDTTNWAGFGRRVARR